MKDRLKYIDCIKGFAILFVIYYHMTLLSEGHGFTGSYSIFQLLCMQLFFFVSGFMSKGLVDIRDISGFVSLMRKKTITLLIPTAMITGIGIVYFHLNLNRTLSDPFKGGYWFTWVLYCIFALQGLLSLLLVKVNDSPKKVLLWLFVAFIIWELRIYVKTHATLVCQYLSMDLILEYYIYFLLGIYIAKHFVKFVQLVDNKMFMGGVVLMSLIPYTPQIAGPEYILIRSTCMVFLTFLIFKKLPMFNTDNIISNQLANMVRNSIGIYYLHYFFLIGLPFLPNFINNLSKTQLRKSYDCRFLIEFVIIAPISILIAYMSMALKSVICQSRILNALLFGNYRVLNDGGVKHVSYTSDIEAPVNERDIKSADS